jgi:hypothetical protein
MKLSELQTKPKINDYDHAIKLLKDRGFKNISTRVRSTVFEHNKLPYMLKLFRDPAFLQFIQCVHENPNVHFPIFRGRPIKITKDGVGNQINAIRIEKLYSYTNGELLMDAMYRALNNDFSQLDKCLSDTVRYPFPKLKTALQILVAWKKKSSIKLFNDIGNGNVMSHGGIPVILDPWVEF